MTNDNDNDKVETFYKKAKLFKEKSIPAHIVIVDSKKFFNGEIVTVKAELCEIRDKEEGIVPIFYNEIFKFEKYIQRGDVE